MLLLAATVVVNQAIAATAAISDTVQAMVKPWIEKEKPPGVIVVVRDDGKTQFFAFGEADAAQHKAVTPDSTFELASITKVFTTTSLAMKVLTGKMRLDDHVVQYLPHLQENGGDIKKVTLKQLATHTSSLPRTPGKPPSDADWDKQSLMQWLAQWHAPYPPGSGSLYSNRCRIAGVCD